MSTPARQTGTFRWFDNSKGYGFIEAESHDDDVFVHYRAILTDEDYKTLSGGQLVEFVQVRSARGWQAAEVVPVHEAIA